MWLARDKEDNVLKLWAIKPIRAKEQKLLVETMVFGKELPMWQTADRWVFDPREVKVEKLQHYFIILDSNLYPDLKWEDEPIQVKIVSLQIDEKKLAKKTLEEALAAKFCGFIPEGETPGLTDLNIFEYAYKLGVIQTLGLFKKPSDLMTIAQMEKENEKDNNETN